MTVALGEVALGEVAPVPLLPADEAHVWLVDLTSPGGRPRAAWRLLDDAERARAARFAFAADRERFVASRACLRAVLAGYVGGRPGDLRFTLGEHDRPALAPGQHGGDLDFNVAHTADLALVAVARQRVGVDLERVSRHLDVADLADHWFAADELACIASGCEATPRRSFYRHWTAKEAYLKAVGCGLSGLRDIALECHPAPAAMRWRGRVDPGRLVTPIALSPVHVAAVVTDATATTIRWRSWPR